MLIPLTFQIFGDEIQIRSIFDRVENDQFQRIPFEQTERVLWQIIDANPFALTTLRGYLPFDYLDTTDLLHQLRSEIEYGRLALYRRRQAYVLHYQPPMPLLEEFDAPEAAQESMKEVLNDWIEIELYDDDQESPEPIAGVEYTIELADGTKKHGCLNQQGWARVDGIKPGTCKVIFPELDQSSWG